MSSTSASSGDRPGQGLLTPTDVRRLLREHGISPRKSRGQHFVIDPNTVRKVIRDAGISPGTRVCEVGPGLGSLTLALRSAGAEVVAIEVDPRLVGALRQVVGDDPGVQIVEADAMDIDLAATAQGGPAALVANLPYNIATPLVLEALASGAFERLFVMVQREVGQRWTAAVGDPAYGAVSVKVRALAEAEIVARVSPQAFYPVPNVESVTVRLRPLPWDRPVDRDAMFALLNTGFAQRRKRLRNALASGGLSPTTVEAALARAGLDPGARAEELTLEDWVALTLQLRR